MGPSDESLMQELCTADSDKQTCTVVTATAIFATPDRTSSSSSSDAFTFSRPNKKAKRDKVDQKVIYLLEKLSNCAFHNGNRLENALTKLSEGVGMALTYCLKIMEWKIEHLNRIIVFRVLVMAKLI